MDKEVKQLPNEEVKELNKCYFCGFNDFTQRHHIIRKSDGGEDEPSNLVLLCPNHHFLIHSRKYFLQLSRGILILVNSINPNTKIIPLDWKDKVIRAIPNQSISNAVETGNLTKTNEGEKICYSLKSNRNGGFFAS